MFPVAALTNIFNFLPPSDIKHGSMLVCKQWQEAAEDPLLWKNVTAKLIAKDFKPHHLDNILTVVLQSLVKKNITSISFHEKCSRDQIMNVCRVLGAHLKRLSLKNCKTLMEEDFVEITQLSPDVIEVNLSSCSFVQSFLINHLLHRELNWFWNNLQKIDLGHTCYEMSSEYSCAVTSISKQCSNLKAIGLSGCKGYELLSLVNNIDMGTLTALDLSYTDIEDDFLLFLSQSDKLHLKEFNIASCKSLSDTFHATLMQFLSTQTSLNVLKISNLRVSFTSLLPAFNQLTQLIHLDMNSCQSISTFYQLDPTERRLLRDPKPFLKKYLKQSYPWSKLKVLKVSSSDMTDDLFGILCVSLCQLTELDISSCPAITDQSISVIRQSLSQIRSLKLGWCSKLTDECLKIVSELKELNLLSLTHCQLVTNKGLMYLSGLKLESLSLAHCKTVSDEGIVVIALNLNTLKYLELAGCSGVTDLSLKIIAKKLSRLEYLNISGCSKISVQSIDNVKQACRHLISLRYWTP